MTDVGTRRPLRPSAPARRPPVPLTGDLVPPYASWGQRVLAALLDSAVLGGVTWLFAGAGVAGPELAPGAVPGPPLQDLTPWLETAPSLVLVALAMLALQGWTGFTPGKRVLGIAVVVEGGDRPPGLLGAVLRVVAHALDAVLLVGYLRPLWHAERRTFADSLVGTVVVRRTRLEPVAWFGRLVRRLPGATSPRAGRVVSVAAGVACLLGLGFGLPVGGSGGYGTAPADAECVVAPSADGAGAVTAVGATVTANGWHEWERRLWVRRSTVDETSVAVDWVWEGAADSFPEVELSASARADGLVLARATEPAEVHVQAVTGGGVVSESTLTVRGVPEPAALPADDLLVVSSLVVDGTLVATCEAVVDTRRLAAAPSS